MSETSLMKVGAVGVDSGRIMLLDPCNEGKRTSDVECEYLPGVRIVLRDEIPLGVIVATPGGDGAFPVIAEIVDGKLNGILLDFGDDDLEKGILGARMIARGEEAPEIVGPVESRGGKSLAAEEAEKALNHLILARRETVDPEELERINHAITAAHMVVEPPADRAKELELRGLTDDQRDQLRYVEGWQGTQPAPGTRRKLILDTLEDFSARLISGSGGKLTGGSCLDAADAIELALLKVVDQGATPESGSPASVAMDLLDRFDVPRTREGAILTIADRVTVLADELVETRRQADIRRASADLLASTVDAQAQLRAAAEVPPQTRDLVIVLEDVSDPDGPPEYRFIELENQDGRSIGTFPIRSSEQPPLKEIVIPYGRDDAWVSEVAYQAAGAATRPLMEDHPDYVFPSERVRDAVAELLKDFGIARACADCAEEQLGHGAKEVDGRRDDTIKSLTLRCDSLLAQRESARAGEDHFKAQRDSALHLVRWLIGDIIPPELIRLGDEEAD